jgi:hypothetical protein
MARWTASQVLAFFESGGSQRPDTAGGAEASANGVASSAPPAATAAAVRADGAGTSESSAKRWQQRRTRARGGALPSPSADAPSRLLRSPLSGGSSFDSKLLRKMPSISEMVVTRPTAAAPQTDEAEAQRVAAELCAANPRGMLQVRAPSARAPRARCAACAACGATLTACARS